MERSNRYADISLTQWMALVPDQLVRNNLNVGSEVMDALRKEKWPVVRFPGYTYENYE